MKNLARGMLIALLFVIGCSNETNLDQEDLTQQELINLLNNFKEIQLLDGYSLSKREIELFQSKGFGGEYVRVFEVRDIKSDELQKLYEIGRDGYIYEDALEAKSEAGKVIPDESSNGNQEFFAQYRTTNLVETTGVRTIEIKAINFFHFQNMDNIALGLVRAVNNYNALNLNIQFELNFYTISTLQESWPLYTPGINVIIHQGTGSNEPGGTALFPSFGNPGKEIRINVATNNQSIDINEHIITHEIGHCIGFRHTDFFDRSISCDEGGNEGDAGIGSIHIPGTPTQVNIDMDSIFLACYNNATDGEFSNTDITALHALY